METIKTEPYAQMRMVIIDDDEAMLRNLKNALVDLGFPVVAFSSPAAALEHIAERGADIVITDVRMPECDGFSVLSKAKQSDPQCEVILMTGHGEMEMAVRALREGAADFFEKPFRTDDLRIAIERTARFRVLDQQRSILSAQLNGLNWELDHVKGQRHVIIGMSAPMQEVARNIVDVAGTGVTVLIAGESGTGKELVANAIHRSGPRAGKPMLTLNCASIPETLFESEMFGHVKGAFTGAGLDRIGYVEAANGGTLFLDEIGDLPFSLQGKMLRLLEQKAFLPVGANKERTSDVRLIAATNRPLEELVATGKFRQDLYYRISGCTISTPALRDRRDDIPLLALHFVLQSAAELGKPSIAGIEDDALTVLANMDYPGNVRELRNILENAVIHCRHPGRLTIDDLPPGLRGAGKEQPARTGEWPFDTLNAIEIERHLYRESLHRTDNNVSAAAKMLGISRSKLRRRLAALKI